VLVPLNKFNTISNNKHNPRTTEVDTLYVYRSGIELHEMIMDSEEGGGGETGSEIALKAKVKSSLPSP